ncbi:Fibrillarin-like rRNA/tRNA 2'-O-methyltransferase [Candidatus Tiddalikarchaeum anstoanum]|nr:Fibrillarin-like rRNA/tRNA 2'-O-methyltransferase [Candidatus Tiddalikarchaeum anstoanum]
MNSSKYFGVYQKGKSLYTKSLVKGQVVYGETIDGEFREWVAKRSKLGAALMNGLKLFPFKEDTITLYLGASSGTTCSHLSDICTKGMIFGVELAPRIFYKFVELAKTRPNLYPILESANDVEKYAYVPPADVVFQDISQKDQVRLFIKNCEVFLKKEGYGILAVKSRSIDVTKPPIKIFNQVRQELSQKYEIVDEKRLEPFEKDHVLFLIKKKK